MTLTREQFDTLYSKGLSVDQIKAFETGQTPKTMPAPIQGTGEDGFFKSLAKGIASPVANLIARPAQLVQHLAGDTQPIEGKFLGLDITDPYARGSSEVIKDIGRGLETLSLGVGGAGTKTVLETGTKGLFKQAVKEGAITGVKAGTLTGAGTSLEKDDVATGQLAYDTLFGAGVGALFGGITGGLLPTGVKTATKVGEIKAAATTEEGILNQIAERNRKVLNPTQRMTAVEDRFFKDSPSFIAKEFPDMPIQIDKGKLDLSEGIEGLSHKYNAEELAFDSLLKGSGKHLDLNQIESQAKAEVRQIFSGTEREKAIEQIEKEMTAFSRQAQEDGFLLDTNGKYLIPATEGNMFKRSLWQRTKGFGTPESEVYNQSNYLLGNSFKNNIENIIEDAPIKAMNKRLGDFISAIKYLEKRNGATPGTGGKLSQMFIRTMGSIAGSGGGIPGTVTGAITADKLATFLANPELTTSMYNQLLKRVAKEGKTDIIQQAQEILNQRAQKAAETLRLPSPSYIPLGPRTPSPSGIIKSGIEDIVASQKAAGVYQPPKLLRGRGENPIPL